MTSLPLERYQDREGKISYLESTSLRGMSVRERECV
jgi:hypothetical protein